MYTYRGRDQYFHTKGAVVHIFKIAPPAILPSSIIEPGEVCLDGQLFYTLPYIANSIQQFRYTHFKHYTACITSKP